MGEIVFSVSSDGTIVLERKEGYEQWRGWSSGGGEGGGGVGLVRQRINPRRSFTCTWQPHRVSRRHLDCKEPLRWVCCWKQPPFPSKSQAYLIIPRPFRRPHLLLSHPLWRRTSFTQLAWRHLNLTLDEPAHIQRKENTSQQPTRLPPQPLPLLPKPSHHHGQPLPHNLHPRPLHPGRLALHPRLVPLLLPATAPQPPAPQHRRPDPGLPAPQRPRLQRLHHLHGHLPLLPRHPVPVRRAPPCQPESDGEDE